MDKRLDNARRLFMRAAALSIGGMALSACGGGSDDAALDTAAGSPTPPSPSSPPAPSPAPTNPPSPPAPSPAPPPPPSAPSPSPPPPSPNPPPAPAPVNPPPAGSSALAAAAAALAPGQWGTWTVSNSFNPDPIGTGDTIFSYAQRATWDAGRRVIQFWGGAHGRSGSLANRMQLVTWNDSSNSWSSPLGAGGNPAYEHGYANATVNQQTGEVYTRLAFGGTDIRVFNQSARGFTATFAEPSGGSNYGTPMEWHPNLLGGSLIWGHYWGIYRRAGSSWVRLGGAGLIGDQAPISAYNQKDDCVYMGGGSGSGGGQLQRISSSGVISACSAPPFPLGIMDSSSSGDTSMILGSGNAANRLVSIAKNGNIREYNEVTNSWSGVISTLPSAILNGVNDGGDWIACSVPTYGCIVVFKLASMTAVSTTAYIWKR